MNGPLRRLVVTEFDHEETLAVERDVIAGESGLTGREPVDDEVRCAGREGGHGLNVHAHQLGPRSVEQFPAVPGPYHFRAAGHGDLATRAWTRVGLDVHLPPARLVRRVRHPAIVGRQSRAP